MTPRLFPTSAAVAALLTACGPSIDPAAKADVDARVARLRAQPNTIPAPAPGAIESMPPAVGHWAQYKMTLPNGASKFLTQKVVGEEGGALLFETVHDSYQGRRVEQFLVAVGDRRDPKKVELRAVRTKDEKGNLRTLSQADLWAARNRMGPDSFYWEIAMDASVAISWQGVPQASAVVIAGRFEGCYYSRVSGTSMTGEAWAHPSVPLGGLVRKHDNQGFASELVAYGTSGARSDL